LLNFAFCAALRKDVIVRRSFFTLGATLLAAISCASLAHADSIRLSCISTISEANIKAIDIWVSYSDEASKKEVKSMTVLWTMPDGSAIDRTVKYSQDLSFDASSPGIFSWSGKEPGDTRPMHGYLQWRTPDFQPEGYWIYTEGYGPSTQTAGIGVSSGTDCVKTDAKSLYTPEMAAAKAKAYLDGLKYERAHLPPQPPPPPLSGEKIALVIGNARYSDADAPMKSPVNDARDVADELKREGFSVEFDENLKGGDMRRAFDEFYARIKPGSVALVFFSGYGIQSNRDNYMVPVDAEIWKEADVSHEGISLQTLLDEIHGRGAGATVAVIDASRKNPFERRFRTDSMGLGPVIPPDSALIAFSQASSAVSSEDDADHSVFVGELLKQMRQPGLRPDEVFNRTRAGVVKATNGHEVPWFMTSLGAEFHFVQK
jgi:caspase domain-containing protein